MYTGETSNRIDMETRALVLSRTLHVPEVIIVYSEQKINHKSAVIILQNPKVKFVINYESFPQTSFEI